MTGIVCTLTYMIHAIFRVASVTIILKPAFDCNCWQNRC